MGLEQRMTDDFDEIALAPIIVQQRNLSLFGKLVCRVKSRLRGFLFDFLAWLQALVLLFIIRLLENAGESSGSSGSWEGKEERQR